MQSPHQKLEKKSESIHIYDICPLTWAAGIPRVTVAVAEAGGAVGGPGVEAVVHAPLVSGNSIDGPAIDVRRCSGGGRKISGGVASSSGAGGVLKPP